MDLISEFAYIISKNRPTDFNEVIPEQSKLKTLYTIVTEQKVESDEDACFIIYNTHKIDKKYLMLKRNLLQKLSELVFKQEYNESYEENYKTIQLQLEKELVIAERLLSYNVYHYPSKILKKVEQVAEKYHLIDVQVTATRIFRSVYSLKGFPKETSQYNKKLKKLFSYQIYIAEAKGMWEEVYALTKFSIAQTPELHDRVKGYLSLIKNWYRGYKSPFLKLYICRFEILNDLQQQNNNKLLELISTLQQLQISHSYLRSRALTLEIKYLFATAYRNINKLVIAKEYIKECIQLSDYQAFDRFQIQTLHWDILMKERQYKDAFEVLMEVYNVPQFDALDALDKSSWAIREAYMFFALFANKQSDLYHKLPNFTQKLTVDEFIQRTKKSVKDKSGYNVNLMIIRLLLYEIERHKEIDKEGNNLKIYFHRYLKDLKGERTVHFFQQLGKFAATGFDKLYFHEHCSECLKVFSNKKNIEYDVFEWIPYDELWRMIALVFELDIRIIKKIG